MCRICDGEGCLNCERDPDNIEQQINEEYKPEEIPKEFFDSPPSGISKKEWEGLMKHAKIEGAKKLKPATLILVRNEVESFIEDGAIENMKTFEDFWNEIDVINGYEEGWEKKKENYKPYFEAVYKELKEQGK